MAKLNSDGIQGLLQIYEDEDQTSDFRLQVLKGKVLYCDDKSFLSDKAYEAIKEFDDFRHRYYDYVGVEAIR